MSTSNSYDFSIDRNGLILAAHQHIGAVGEGETCSSNQNTEAAILLNMIVKTRAAMGMPLWALKRGYVLPVTGTSEIATSAQVVSSYVQTTTSAASSSGATTITLTSVTGVSNTYNIGVEQDDGTMLWTTVSGAPAGSVVTLATALTDDVASGNYVYVYQTANRVPRIIRVTDMNINNLTSASTYPIEQVARESYYNLGNRAATGTPSQAYVDVGLTAQSFFVYPRFLYGDVIIEFTYQAPFQDFDASTDTPDFPQEFYLPLMMELASFLGPKYGVPLAERKQLFSEAMAYFDMALTSNYPEGSMFIQPDTQWC